MPLLPVIRADVQDLRREVGELLRVLAALAERAARIQGALGWRALVGGGPPTEENHEWPSLDPASEVSPPIP